MPIRPEWQREVRGFVSSRNILGVFTPWPSTWRDGVCMRCGSDKTCLRLDAYIPVCADCKPIVDKEEAKAETS